MGTSLGTDGTEQQRLERYRTLIESIDGIIWEADPRTLRFTFVSRQAERILGYPLENWIEDPEFWARHLHPEDRDWAMSYCYNATHDLADHKLDYRMIAADGRSVWLRSIVSVVAEGGRAVKLRGLMLDITDRKEAEQKRLQTEFRARRRAALLVELARRDELARGKFAAFGRLAIEAIARELQVERVSLWLFGEDRSVLRCHDLYELSVERHSAGTELRASKYPRYFKALERGRTVAAGQARRHPDTREFRDDYLVPLGITSMLDAPLRRGGRVSGVICHEQVGEPREWSRDDQDFAASVADLIALALETEHRQRAERDLQQTQSKLLEQQRREQERVQTELDQARDLLVRRTRLATIGQVAASIAHDLRNPLGAIRNAAFFLKRHLPDDQPHWVEHLEIIDREVHTSDRILGNLLEMSRAKEVSKQAVDVREAFDRAVGQVEGAQRLKLMLDLEPDPFAVEADPEQFQRLLVNLVSNAAQLGERVTTLVVRARRDEAGDCLLFEDDGPGVSAEHGDRIFEPLFTTKAKGTGLGLAICRQILERHDGVIDLVRSGGQGAAFRLRLPR